MENEVEEKQSEQAVAAPPMKIFVAAPSYDSKVFVPCVQSLLNAIQVLLVNKIEMMFRFECGSPYVSLARNNLARAFMESGFTDMIFIDADLGFPPKAFRDLIDSPEELIAGAYPKKQDDTFFPIFAVTDETNHPVVENGVIQVNGMATGFMKIKRSVFEKIAAAHPELEYMDTLTNKKTFDFFGTFVKDGRWYGDDFGFCKLWMETGGKCWVLPDITFIHAGSKNYVGNLHEFLTRLGDKELADKGAPGWTSENTPKE